MKKLLVLLGAVLLGGCVSTREVATPAGVLESLRGRTLTVATYKKPDFSAMTYGRAMIGGLIGAGVMLSEGNAVIAQNDVPDPAQAVAAKLAPMLSAKLMAPGVNFLKDRDAKGDTEDVLSAAVNQNGVVMDVETINWSFLYYPLDWTHYRVVMVMRARIIDAQSGKRLAQAPCQYLSNENSPPTYDEMLADHAAKLKSMLAAGAEICAAGMMKTLLDGS
jgi:hypothetical protein